MLVGEQRLIQYIFFKNDYEGSIFTGNLNYYFSVTMYGIWRTGDLQKICFYNKIGTILNRYF